MTMEDYHHYSSSTIKKYYPEYDFVDYKASDYIYSIPTYRYPAALHYKLVNTLIREFTDVGDLVFDPFCGSGTVINEAVRLYPARHALGIDINPLGLLIAEVRLMHDIEIDGYIERLMDRYHAADDDLVPDIPELTNPEYWYPRYVLTPLGKIRRFILEIDDSRVKKFLTLVLADTARYASYTRKNEFKRFRMKDWQSWRPDVLEYFIRTAYRYQYELKRYPKPDQNSSYRLSLHDMRKPLPTTYDKKVALMLTSPPYGDSKTTVAYGEFSSFGLEWINGILFRYDWRSIDRESLGGKRSSSNDNNNNNKDNDTNTSVTFDNNSGLACLKEVLKNIKDDKRRIDLISYMSDLYTCIVNISRTIKEGGYMIFVVGNRKMSGIQIPTDEIIARISEGLGFKHIETRYRRILNKTMPLLNSPTNEEGKKDSTMLNEYIVILRRGV